MLLHTHFLRRLSQMDIYAIEQMDGFDKG
jgi:hypothetical protein